MSNKKYEEADGVFDIDGDDADQDLDLDAEQTTVRPPKPRTGLARNEGRPLGNRGILVVFVVVLVYRLSRPSNDVIAKRSNEAEPAAKTNTPKKTEPDTKKPTVVTPARQGTSGTNPWATDFSKKSQAGRPYGNVQGTNSDALTSDDAMHDAPVRSDTVGKNPFDAREVTSPSRDSKTEAGFDLSNTRPGSAYGNITESDGPEGSDAKSLAIDPSGDRASTQATATFRDGSQSGAETRDPFGLAKRSTGSMASAATAADSDAESAETDDADSAKSDPPLKFGGNDLLSGTSAEWDKNQEQRSKSAVPEGASVGSNKVAPAKQQDKRTAPPRNTKVAAADGEALAPSMSVERNGESLRFGFDRATQPAETAEDRATEAPRFAGSRKNAFDRQAPAAPARQIDADENLDSPTSAPLQTASTTPSDEQMYVAQPGDTYWKISQQFYGSGAYFKALYEHNRRTLRNPDRLQAGADLQVPDEATLRRLYPALCPASTRKTASTGRATRAVATARNTEPTYVVEDGDTLYEIARSQLGKSSRWGEIFELNRDVLGDKLNALSPGTELLLPADAQRASTTRQTGGLNSEAE